MVENTPDEAGISTQQSDDHPVLISPTVDFLLVGVLISVFAFGAAAVLL